MAFLTKAGLLLVPATSHILTHAAVQCLGQPAAYEENIRYRHAGPS